MFWHCLLLLGTQWHRTIHLGTDLGTTPGNLGTGSKLTELENMKKTKMTRSQMIQRRNAITSDLVRMSHDGWRSSRQSDYAPLEAELRTLTDALRKEVRS